MVPTMFEMLLEVPDKARFDTGSVRRLMSAGSPLLTATKERLLEFFPDAGLYELYGSTEAGFFSILKPEDQLRKERSAGLPYFGCELRILDPDGNDVPAGTVGQIYKRGAGLGVRYYKNPAATEDQFHGEWISSGDLGRFDEEGYLYVVDRAKDMIISGGVNIFPTEIEDVLVKHPDVVEAAVIGRPDPKWGEIVTAYVVTRKGVPVPERELNALCREKLAAYKRPRAYLALDELPKNASGKLLKRVLKEPGGQRSDVTRCRVDELVPTVEAECGVVPSGLRWDLQRAATMATTSTRSTGWSVRAVACCSWTANSSRRTPSWRALER